MVDFSKHLKQKKPMKAGIDLETACGVKTCPGYDQANSSLCDHAVCHIRNKIKIIGVFSEEYGYVNFRDDVVMFDAYCTEHQIQGVFHNGKFDFKVLKAKGSKFSLRNYIGDTQVAGACVRNKVSDTWCKIYNDKRAELNAKLPHKQKHRVGTPLSLKTMAPYYLGIKPFWENPLDHDDEEYNAKDCEYTLRLHAKLLHLMELDRTRDFYETYILQWQKLLCEAEYEGLLIDTKLLYKMYGDAIKERDKLEKRVHVKVKPCYEAFLSKKIEGLVEESAEKCRTFCAKLKNRDKVLGAEQRYAESLNAKISALPEQFNLNSPPQMLDILMWAGIDTTVDVRLLGEMIEKEQANKFVLKRAKVAGNDFASALLDYREKETEVRYLKQYIESLVGDRIYGGFNITGTRTGRLSSSGPNLQNIKGSLRLPFIIADSEKYSIYTVDSSQIEPRVIAYLTQDKDMVQLFIDGRDFHNYATKLFFPNETKDCEEKDIKEKHKHLRNDVAKHCDLSGIYGTGPDTLINMILVRAEKALDFEWLKKALKSYKKSLAGVMQWKADLEGAYNNGTHISDRFGFPVQAGASVYMTLFNTFIQGMASRMIFHASMMAQKQFWKEKIDAKPLAWVHDEVIWRFPKGKEEYCRKIVDHYMTAYKLETQHGVVPLACEGKIADRWEK
jgi:DNA polymerase I-like protein with 3'-5' exonuclease and polymerase domains